MPFRESKDKPSKLLDKVFDCISLCFFRYISTFALVWRNPQDIELDTAKEKRYLRPSLYWLINVLLLDLFFYDVAGNEIVNIFWSHTIEDRLYRPIYEILGLFLGNILFSVILSRGLKWRGEESFLRIFYCTEYASALYLPYAILVGCIKFIFNQIDSQGLLVLSVFYETNIKSFSSMESIDIFNMLLAMPMQEFLIPFGIGILLSILLWGIGLFLWGRIVYQALHLKQSIKRFIIVLVVTIGISLVPLGIFAYSQMKHMDRTADYLIEAMDTVKMEEIREHKNYLLLSYLCHYISQSISNDEANQFKYEVLSVLYKQIYMYQSLGFDKNGNEFSMVTSNVSTLTVCNTYLSMAHIIYDMCKNDIVMLDKEEKLGFKPGDTVVAIENSEKQLWLDNPNPNENYSYYSFEMVLQKKRLDEIDEKSHHLLDEKGDYIYSDFFIPVNQSYAIPVYAKLDVNLFPFCLCFL